MDEEILKRIVLTPAERQVVLEQIDSTKVAFDGMRGYIEAGDIKRMISVWVEVTAGYEYMSSILNQKTHAAIHSVMRDKGEG